MIDFGSSLFTPIYQILGVDAVIIPKFGVPIEVTVIDKTHGIQVMDRKTQTATIKPAAAIRMTDLTGYNVTRDDVRGGSLQMNGKSWRIESLLPKPVPNGGEAAGELYMILTEVS